MGQKALRAQLREAYRRLLNPLVRTLIRNGVSASETIGLLKHVFVEAAASKEFELSGKPNSDTRIAILTGLTKTEVEKLRRQTKVESFETGSNEIRRLLAAWNQDSDFTGPYGVPKMISFEARPGDTQPTFTELVKRHCRDTSPHEMLDELKRVGLIEIDSDGLIRSTGRAYIPSKMDPAALERYGLMVGRLADTLDFNNSVERPALGRFERDVTTDIGLTEEQARRFNVYLRTKCQELLVVIDNWLAAEEGRLTAQGEAARWPSNKKIRTGIGIFHYSDQGEQHVGLENTALRKDDDEE